MASAHRAVSSPPRWTWRCAGVVAGATTRSLIVLPPKERENMRERDGPVSPRHPPRFCPPGGAGTRNPPASVDPCLPRGSLTISRWLHPRLSLLLAVQHEGLKCHLQPAEVPQGLLHRTVAVRSAILPTVPHRPPLPRSRTTDTAPPRGKYESIDRYLGRCGIALRATVAPPAVLPCIGASRGPKASAACCDVASAQYRTGSVGAWAHLGTRSLPGVGRTAV